MRLVHATAFALAAALLMPAVPGAQGGGQKPQEDPSRKVAGGGINAAGWKGRVDPQNAKKGEMITSSKFEMKGNTFNLTIGPPAIYWNPANTATGNYTVKATFREPKQINDHAHAYGVFIGGKDLEADTQNYLYCSVYGTGTYIVRGFNGTTNVRFSSPKGAPHDAINKFGADGGVTNEVAIKVTADTVECQVNGKPVFTAPKADITAAGKLTSTDGIYGIRASHNVDVVVTNFGMTKG